MFVPAGGLWFRLSGIAGLSTQKALSIPPSSSDTQWKRLTVEGLVSLSVVCVVENDQTVDVLRDIHYNMNALKRTQMDTYLSGHVLFYLQKWSNHGKINIEFVWRRGILGLAGMETKAVNVWSCTDTEGLIIKLSGLIWSLDFGC